MEEIIKEEIELLSYLFKKFSKLSKNSVKNLLTSKKIVINDKVITQYNYLLKVGDRISFNGKKETFGLKIIYEDDVFLVIDKPSSLLTVATDKEKEKTAYVLASRYIKQNNVKNKIFVLHRLDKDTSGILVFCKNEKIKEELQEKWNDIVIKRKYYAIVEGKINKKEGVIKSYLKEDKTRMVYSTKSKDGKLAITEYQVIKENDKYTLVDINLLTGRKNQIRVHFKDIGNPLVGDKKYGAISNSINRLALHAYSLEFKYNDKVYNFQCEMPNIMKKVI